jgi:hypothetical protein
MAIPERGRLAVLLLLSCSVGASAYVATLRPVPRSVARARGCHAVAVASDFAALGVAGLPLEKTVRGFQLVPDQKLRYQQVPNAHG